MAPVRRSQRRERFGDDVGDVETTYGDGDDGVEDGGGGGTDPVGADDDGDGGGGDDG